MTYALSFLLVAVLIDLVGYWGMKADQKKGYYPNLQLWGVAFLIGLCLKFVWMTAGVLERLLYWPGERPSTWLALTNNLALLLLPGALLILTVWAIAKICRKE
jgi:membrane-bound metal-dependent hydrolase YbcI (DUF457 family)